MAIDWLKVRDAVRVARKARRMERLDESDVRSAVEHFAQLLNLVDELYEHLDYCGWGDSYEREVSEHLRNLTQSALKETS